MGRTPLAQKFLAQKFRVGCARCHAISDRKNANYMSIRGDGIIAYLCDNCAQLVCEFIQPDDTLLRVVR